MMMMMMMMMMEMGAGSKRVDLEYTLRFKILLVKECDMCQCSKLCVDLLILVTCFLNMRDEPSQEKAQHVQEP